MNSSSPITPKDDELIERLNAKARGPIGTGLTKFLVNPDGPAAASRIAELKAEREMLRTALIHFASHAEIVDAEGLDDMAVPDFDGWSLLAKDFRQARSALSNPPSGEVS